MHITKLDYLENRFFSFTKLLNNNIKKLNKVKELNKATILDNNNQYLLNLPDLKAKLAKKIKKKLKSIN